MSRNLVYCDDCKALRAWERTFVTSEKPATAEMSCGHQRALSEIFNAMLPGRKTYQPDRVEYR